MRRHNFISHKTAISIVRELYGTKTHLQAHPGSDRTRPRSFDWKLRQVRREGLFAFTEVPDSADPDLPCLVHFWARSDIRPELFAAMIGHELGHISGGGPYGQGRSEELRADSYGDVAAEAVVLLLASGLLLRP